MLSRTYNKVLKDELFLKKIVKGPITILTYKMGAFVVIVSQSQGNNAILYWYVDVEDITQKRVRVGVENQSEHLKNQKVVLRNEGAS